MLLPIVGYGYWLGIGYKEGLLRDPRDPIWAGGGDPKGSKNGERGDPPLLAWNSKKKF